MARSGLVESEGRIGNHRTDPEPQFQGEVHFRRGESTGTRPNVVRGTKEVPKVITHKSTEELPLDMHPTEGELDAVKHATDLSQRVSGSIRPGRGNESVRIAFENRHGEGGITQVGVVVKD